MYDRVDACSRTGRLHEAHALLAELYNTTAMKTRRRGEKQQHEVIHKEEGNDTPPTRGRAHHQWQSLNHNAHAAAEAAAEAACDTKKQKMTMGVVTGKGSAITVPLLLSSSLLRGALRGSSSPSSSSPSSSSPSSSGAPPPPRREPHNGSAQSATNAITFLPEKKEEAEEEEMMKKNDFHCFDEMAAVHAVSPNLPPTRSGPNVSVELLWRIGRSYHDLALEAWGGCDEGGGGGIQPPLPDAIGKNNNNNNVPTVNNNNHHSNNNKNRRAASYFSSNNRSPSRTSASASISVSSSSSPPPASPCARKMCFFLAKGLQYLREAKARPEIRQCYRAIGGGVMAMEGGGGDAKTSSSSSSLLAAKAAALMMLTAKGSSTAAVLPPPLPPPPPTETTAGSASPASCNTSCCVFPHGILSPQSVAEDPALLPTVTSLAHILRWESAMLGLYYDYMTLAEKIQYGCVIRDLFLEAVILCEEVGIHNQLLHRGGEQQQQQQQQPALGNRTADTATFAPSQGSSSVQAFINEKRKDCDGDLQYCLANWCWIVLHFNRVEKATASVVYPKNPPATSRQQCEAFLKDSVRLGSTLILVPLRYGDLCLEDRDGATSASTPASTISFFSSSASSLIAPPPPPPRLAEARAWYTAALSWPNPNGKHKRFHAWHVGLARRKLAALEEKYPLQPLADTRQSPAAISKL